MIAADPATPVLLIIDDDPGTCALTATMLERAGFATRQANSGADGLAVLAAEPIALVLLDVMMPGMSGFDVCEAMRERGIQIPVILVTARDDLDTRAEGMRRGVSELLTKPIDRHELAARVRAQLHILALERQLETIERNVAAATGAPSVSKPG